MNTERIIFETLTSHHTWDVKIMKGLMVCAGPGCDWSRKPLRGESNTAAFREHQADMIAAVLAEQPKPAAGPWGARDDLTVFAALLAKLGGEATVTFAEATRVTGVHVTRWDEPDQYRFTLDAPEFRDLTPARVSLESLVEKHANGTAKTLAEIIAEDAHQCETWMIRRNIDGGRYCAACGATA
jgi:hypothetical protein